MKIIREFSLRVDYTKSIEEMIILGQYAEVDQLLNKKNFPLPDNLYGKQLDLRAKIIHPGEEKVSHSQLVLDMMEENALRPGTIFELLSLGYIYPHWQEEFSVVALGSFLDWFYNHQKAAWLLSVPEKGRVLATHFAGFGWHHACNFLAVEL